MFTLQTKLRAQLAELESAGLYKHEREILGPQSAHIETAAGKAINFCANNYLGIANHPEIVEAAKAGLDEFGFGLSSVRFICGTQTQHRALEREIAAYVGKEDAILFSSCFDANGGVFEALLTANDAIVSDALNHASLIDGIRLCKAARYRYANGDMHELRSQLETARKAGAEQVMIVTDGVFSMDGCYAPLPEICALAEEFSALVLVDDSHAIGFVGKTGAGTPQLFGVQDKVDILTGTLGKALGGASGGYVAGPQEVIDTLRQKARPYLFSNTLAPAIVAGSRKALEIAHNANSQREQIAHNTKLFRALMQEAEFELLPGEHAIIAVMFPGESGALKAQKIASHLLNQGIYVTAFSFPVVPRGQARIRVQLSAAHSTEDIKYCVQCFIKARDAINNEI